MASRENPKVNGKTSSELKLIGNESLQNNVLASISWNQPPLCWLTPEQKSRLQEVSETFRYNLGEKIWSPDIGNFQFLIVSGKVRLRSEGANQPLATLQPGDWFGNLQKFSFDCKAVAASKEVVVVRWDTTIWAEVSTPQIEEFWQGGEEEWGRERKGEGGEEQILSPTSQPQAPSPSLPPSFPPLLLYQVIPL
ncbi:hypothetical protein AB0758_26245 [Tolypothrix bouteillei VB521301_2]